MTGRERVQAVLQRKKSDQVPWVPYIGIHGARLIDVSAETYLKSGELMEKGILEAVAVYKPDGIPVTFDLQAEAEALGCGLKWYMNSPPSVVSIPIGPQGKSIPTIDPETIISLGRIPMLMEVAASLREKLGDTTSLYGLVTGPLTLAAHLRGHDFMMDLVEDPDYVRRLLAYTCKVVKVMAKAYLAQGVDLIALVDPMISQISPDAFREFLGKPYKEIFDLIKDQGGLTSGFVCGNATKQIEVLCQTGPDMISVDENTYIIEAKEICDRYKVTLSGNIPVTTLLLYGSVEECEAYSRGLMNEFGQKGGFILATACDVPYDTCPKKLLATRLV